MSRKIMAVEEQYEKGWESLSKITNFIYHSNAIENIHHDRKTIENILWHRENDIPEIYNHHKAFNYFRYYEELPNTHNIKELHKLLMKDILIQGEKNKNGKFRKYNVRVGDYTAPDYKKIKTMMKDLEKFIFNYDDNVCTHSEFAWEIHDKFERIHPFGDGNGRVGRLLLNWIRKHYGLSLMIVKYEDRFKYYKKIRSGH